jgi:hypothetical protein
MAQIGILKSAPGEGDLPFHPFVNVELLGYGRDDEDRILLSPSLITDGEIDYRIDALIEQLEAARKDAKRHVATARGSAAWCRAQSPGRH